MTQASFSTSYAATTSTPEFVRLQCQGAMQSLRILQRAHWEAAIAERSSAIASPYTISFQTLPEHWRFVVELARHILLATKTVSLLAISKTPTPLR